MAELNEFQQVAKVAFARERKDPIYLIDDTDSTELVGDALFEFVMIELSDIEDCDSFECAITRIQTASQTLNSVANALNKHD